MPKKRNMKPLRAQEALKNKGETRIAAEVKKGEPKLFSVLRKGK